MAVLPLLISLLLFPISGQTQQPNATSSFSISDPAWLPTDNRTLLSPNSLFSAGFLPHPANSSLFLFTIWVEASAGKPSIWFLGPVPSSSLLSISPAGVLYLAGPSGNNLFPSSASGPPNSSLLLNNDGSLTFNKWTSFSSPTNTLLPSQTSQKSISLVAGEYHFNGSSLLFHSISYWSTPGNTPILSLSSRGGLIVDPNNPQNSLVTNDYGEQKTLRRLTLSADGNLRVYSLQRQFGEWKMVWQAVLELCLIPNTCGPNSVCVPDQNYDAVKCVCPAGFRNSTTGVGCERKKNYLPSSKFFSLDFVQFTATQGTADMSPMNFYQCQSACLYNSNCVGFSFNFAGTQTCLNHYGNLVNGFWSSSTQTSLQLRVATTETDTSNFDGMTSRIQTACPVRISLPVPPKETRTTARNAAVIAALFALELLVGVLCFWAFLLRYSKYRDMARIFGLEYLPVGSPKRFSYAELQAATADFSNILGGGGYGTVYRGRLPDGRTIAVKRLGKSSGGDAEFWAEVTIIARMHHINLVRIWGFCAEKEKRLLVYEYIPNGSLDKFLFQPPAPDGTEHTGIGGGTRPFLDWSVRYRIALGVARAIAYLHEECLEWVLHCDIKPENILLDENFCPKVSDFGLSKLAKKKERVSMSRIRGTRGYMAPEWVMNDEPITAKADVYSFGVVLLELVAGMRCWDFRRDSVESVDWYFPRWAYDKVFVERKVEDILDWRILGSFDDGVQGETIERMVKTAMWCLQDRAVARPSMGKVAKMLEGAVEITEPAKPTIFYLTEEQLTD
ncbi:G-type lectin S-receptor-like serine/threonine-protein kinase [Apostasia shenzhenica]|uniref:non-specific serine/threonine protein kinase n=1 Tax=Apostasia shenzhenica TaxID=1088818 RepID=A0A2I0B4N6_9ASPA|nr:G-type lectin S-receptor-like serine/threonine-protein kinase [Apostasia shenzhenica]